MSLIQVSSALIYAAAACCVFLILLNRLFMCILDRETKPLVLLVTFVVLVGGGIVLGYLLPRPPWIYVPLALLTLVLVGEGHRVFVRRKSAGLRPVDTIPHACKLTAPVTTTALDVHRYRLPHKKWHGEPFRIVHLTDLHVHASLPLDYYQDVVSAAEETKPDLAVFTGDFISRVEALPILSQVLRPIAGVETCAVLGNHDYWADADAVRAVVRGAGLRLLTNESIRISSGKREIAVTGYDYPWGTRARHIDAPAGEMFHIVLSHTPDNIYRLSSCSADLVFSGHYHAGQMRLPILGPMVIPSIYGRRFDHGHFVVNDTHLFVASGIGASHPPVRIWCRPDIFVVDILPEGDPRP